MKSKRKTKRKSKKAKGKLTWVCHFESPKENINRLIEVYKQDKIKAKVLYTQNKDSYFYYRLIQYSRPDGSFEFVIYNVRYGMSITNIVYHRTTKLYSIIYKDNKLWYSHNNPRHKVKLFKPLTFWDLNNFLNPIYSKLNYYSNPVYNQLESKFGWLRNIKENEKFYNIPFNTILSKKLFGANDIIRHMYKCPLPVAKMIMENTKNYAFNDFLKIWKEMKKVLLNVENLKVEMLGSAYFMDACIMAGRLGRKVNCSWSKNRLKTEHDNWAKEITNILIELEPFKELKIAQWVKDFAAVSGYQLLKSNHDLMHEGRKMNHCVATYISSVDEGRSGIFHIEGCTLEVRVRINFNTGVKDIDGSNLYKDNLYISQFKSFSNRDVPPGLYNEVKDKIDKYNSTLPMHIIDMSQKGEWTKEAELDEFVDNLGLPMGQINDVVNNVLNNIANDNVQPF